MLMHIWLPLFQMLFQTGFYFIISKPLSSKSKSSCGSGKTALSISRLPYSVVVQEATHIQQGRQVYLIYLFQLCCQRIGVTDISPNHFGPYFMFYQVGARGFERRLVIVCTYKK